MRYRYDGDQSVARVIRNFRRDVIQIFIRLGYNTIQSIYGAVIDQRAVNSRKASYELRLETVPRKKKKKERKRSRWSRKLRPS